MIGEQLTLDLDRDALDQAAARADAIIEVSYAIERAGRPLSRAQRGQQAQAEQLARFWTRQERKAGHR